MLNVLRCCRSVRPRVAVCCNCCNRSILRRAISWGSDSSRSAYLSVACRTGPQHAVRGYLLATAYLLRQIDEGERKCQIALPAHARVARRYQRSHKVARTHARTQVRARTHIAHTRAPACTRTHTHTTHTRESAAALSGFCGSGGTLRARRCSRRRGRAGKPK